MQEEVIEKLAILSTSAFGLVAALAWNSAIQAIFREYFTIGEGIAAMVTYAIIVTVIAVIISVYIGRLKEKYKEDVARKKKKR
jgi:membrane protein YdbS with pleckstrin-like domain